MKQDSGCTHPFKVIAKDEELLDLDATPQGDIRKSGWFVLGFLATVETRHRLYSSSKSNRQGERALVGSSDGSGQYLKHEMFLVDCLATVETRQRLYYIL
jgi:hypothetical protein